MNSFLFSFNAVVPMFCIILLGTALKRSGLMAGQTASQMNKIAFTLLIPCLVFHNIYSSGASAVLHPRLMIFAALSILLVFCASWFAVLGIEKTPAKRGAMIQGMFRSNFALFGVPVVINLFGDQAAGIPSLLVSIVIPLYNILAVVTLETFSGSAVKPWNIAKGIARNPLLLASLAGVLFLQTGLRLPHFLEIVVEDVAAAATPISLIAMGASFQFVKSAEHKKQLTAVVATKLLLVPVLCLSAAVALGFRDIELASILAIYASPVAIASYPMAVQMKSDGDLAAGIVVFTTLLACPTMFFFIFTLSHCGLF